MVDIRPEQPGDVDAIREVTRRAFDGQAYADGDEHLLIDALRRAGALTLSLVAEADGQLLGQITFSPAIASAGRWYTLGPVAVDPDHQSNGIGAALIECGLKALSDAGADGCILTGNPLYYRRFGFELTPAQVPANEPAEYFMVKALTDCTPEGRFQFHEVFSAPIEAPEP